MNSFRRSSGGFTLVEALISLVLFAAVVVLLQGGFARGLAGMRAADRERAGLDCASSVVAAAGTTARLSAGMRETGSCNDISWEMIVTPYDPESSGDNKPVASIVPLWVEVTATWRERTSTREHSLKLRTLKLSQQNDAEK